MSIGYDAFRTNSVTDGGIYMQKYYVRETIQENAEGEKLVLIEVDTQRLNEFKYLLIFENGQESPK